MASIPPSPAERPALAPTRLAAEWLEADGLGGFASGTVAGVRTRRYHALLLAATTPPTGRVALVSGFDAWIEPPGMRTNGNGREFLTIQRYAPGVTAGGQARLVAFEPDPWPAWTWVLGDGTEITGELFVPKGSAAVCLRWRAPSARPGLRLVVRPFLTGRDVHALHHENPELRSDADVTFERVRWQTYPSLPAVLSVTSGSYLHAPLWYRSFELDEERNRGFDFVEDAMSPGQLSFDLSTSDAVWLLGAEGGAGVGRLFGARPIDAFRALQQAELVRRSTFPSRLHRAADAYLVARGSGRTIVAGYPWFTDWGRDTFISLRGLCLVTGRLDDAREILEAWAATVSQGMLPNRFVDEGDVPEFNSVDASLWFVIACWEYLRACEAAGRPVSEAERRTLEGASWNILAGYATGTRYRIHIDDDGMLCSGEPGVQLTWMDAKVGDWVVTPRIGKPVEVQALWLNALRIGAMTDARWAKLYNRGVEAFRSRFWNPERGCLFDVVDEDRIRGKVDPTIRPNQIFAIGGLPFPLFENGRAGEILETVRTLLLTPIGLRSLAPDEGAYVPRYEGGPLERDGAYHQGTVWPWLLGPFVEAWLRVRGDTEAVRAEIRRVVVQPLLAHLEEAGLGHVSEIADAEPPHTPRGCPFQAWSVAEALRIVAMTSARPSEEEAGMSEARRAVKERTVSR